MKKLVYIIAILAVVCISCEIGSRNTVEKEGEDSLGTVETTTMDETKEVRGLVGDGTVTRTDGKRVRCLRLYHDQGNVPEYYTTKAYSCFALEDIDADSVQVTLNTYKGTIVRCIAR